MTVHASKGLESPIVFLPDTTSVPWKNTQQNARILWDGALPVAWLSKGSQPLAIGELLQQKNQATEEEYRRLFYVALTRAEDRLYICGALDKTDDKADAALDPHSWYGLAEAGFGRMGAVESFETGQLKSVTLQTELPRLDFPKSENAAPTKLPDFARAPLPKERDAITFISPSRLTPAPNDSATLIQPSVLYWRGTLLHRLLQILPNVIEEERAAMADRIIHSLAPDIDDRQRGELRAAATKVIDDPRFHFLFDGDAVAEASIMADDDGRVITGQIDRLVVTDDAVWIVDYKTNRNPPRTEQEIPAALYQPAGGIPPRRAKDLSGAHHPLRFAVGRKFLN